MNFLGKNIRYLRKRSAKTQTDLARLIKKGQTTIGNWENQISEPNIEELLLISNYFEVPVDTLLKVDLLKAENREEEERELNSRMANERTTDEANEAQWGNDNPLPAPPAATYDHSGMPLSFVKDKDETTLPGLVDEIREMRAEIERIKHRIDAANG